MLLLLISKWFLRVTKELSLAKNLMFSAGVKVEILFLPQTSYGKGTKIKTALSKTAQAEN